ncbi:hypothetical protein MT325_m521L [Paramecium bursaria chlorella virus MT325]|uniref:Uncharacterized protein m521L n=1 Tax=Paramecium bursaria Chlorella virus MT325 TaxID=346932 RepID=A7IUQ1_PBCVM|nr:hypothetical protein MT325_m521L [Paramecium bursaria chlorella virus MT325]
MLVRNYKMLNHPLAWELEVFSMVQILSGSHRLVLSQVCIKPIAVTTRRLVGRRWDASGAGKEMWP